MIPTVVEKALKEYEKVRPEAVNKFLKSEMDSIADVRPETAYEWMRDEYSNMMPLQIEAQLDAMREVHKQTVLEWVQENYQSIPTRHPCPDPSDCEIEIREA